MQLERGDLKDGVKFLEIKYVDGKYLVEGQVIATLFVIPFIIIFCNE